MNDDFTFSKLHIEHFLYKWLLFSICYKGYMVNWSKGTSWNTLYFNDHNAWMDLTPNVSNWLIFKNALWHIKNDFPMLLVCIIKLLNFLTWMKERINFHPFWCTPFICYILGFACMCLYINFWFLFANKVQYAIEMELFPMTLWSINKFANHFYLVNNIIFFPWFGFSYCSDKKETRCVFTILGVGCQCKNHFQGFACDMWHSYDGLLT